MFGASEIEIAAYDRADAALLGLIRGEHFASRSASSRRQRAEARLSRVRVMLRALRDPQCTYPIVHVTGTSGKGSTAATVAAILTASGYRVGLRTSPYLQVSTEKLQIGSLLIDAASFEQMVRRVLGVASDHYPADESGTRISYAEAWAVLGYWWFAERDVDLAVVEVAAGGRFDATNVIDPVVSVITSVGLDHTLTLGPTLADIAWHKAGIIKPGAEAVIGDVPEEAFAVIVEEADAAGVRIVRPNESGVPLPGMRGAFQVRNARVAVTVARLLCQIGFSVPNAAIVEGLKESRLPGRLERMPTKDDPTVWVDGAHNAEKISALAQEIAILSGSGPLPVIVLGVLRSKDPVAIVAGLRSAASSMVITEPRVVGKQSLEANRLANALTAAGFVGDIHIEPDADTALQRAKAVARASGAPVFVTGSMYLAGQIRRHWYRDEDIVLARTSWPTPSDEQLPKLSLTDLSL